MSGRVAAWISWSVAGVSVACAALGAFFLLVNGAGIRTQEFDYSAGGVLLALSFSAVGGLICSRRPSNPIGWIFLAVGFSQGLDAFGTQYAEYALVTDPGSLPGGAFMAWLATWTWAPGAGLVATLTLLLFPEGRPPSTGWHWVPPLVVAAIALMVLPTAIVLWPMRGPALAGNNLPGAVAGGLALWLQGIGLLLAGVCMVASVISVAVRFARSRGAERQQLKWLTYAGFVTLTSLFVAFFAPESLRATGLWPVISLFLLLTGPPSIPVAVGIAILRYRLYDIDLLINRTLVYGSLTLMLALVYSTGVVVLQYAWRSVTGGESQLAVVASTLAIAALFNPLRHAIQTFIDRRFYRSKYDAAKTLEAFSARLREETDLDRLGGELVSVVHETMHPHHASLWLRPPRKLGQSEGGTNDV